MPTFASSECFFGKSSSHNIAPYYLTSSKKIPPAMEVSHSFPIVHGQAPLRDQIEYCLAQVMNEISRTFSVARRAFLCET